MRMQMRMQAPKSDDISQLTDKSADIKSKDLYGQLNKCLEKIHNFSVSPKEIWLKFWLKMQHNSNDIEMKVMLR